jgi:hypothetical protein
MTMEIEPKSLGAPLHKRKWTALWFALGCVGLAAFAIRASRPSQWIISVFVLGPTFWITFGGPTIIHRWQSNRVLSLRGLIFILRIAVALAVLQYVVPFLVALLDKSFFHA